MPADSPFHVPRLTFPDPPPPPTAREVLELLGSDEHFGATYGLGLAHARAAKEALAPRIAAHAAGRGLSARALKDRQGKSLITDGASRAARSVAASLASSAPLSMVAGAGALVGGVIGSLAGPAGAVAGALTGSAVACLVAAPPLAAAGMTLLRLEKRHLAAKPELTRRTPLSRPRHLRDNRVAYPAANLLANGPMLGAGLGVAVAGSAAAATGLSIASLALAPVTVTLASCARVAILEHRQPRVAGPSMGLVRDGSGKLSFDGKLFDTHTAQLERPLAALVASDLRRFLRRAWREGPATYAELLASPEGRRDVARHALCMAASQVTGALVSAGTSAAGLGSLASVGGRMAGATVGTLPMARRRAGMSASAAAPRRGAATMAA